MIMFKRFSFYIALAGLILTGVLIKILGSPTPEATAVVPPAVNPYEVSIGASGIVEAEDKNILIGVPESGLVLKLFVKVGDTVKAGDPLFQLDDRDLQAKLATQKANVHVAEATVKRLQDQLQRLKSVSDPRAVSQDDVTTRENDVMVAEAQRESARGQVQETMLLIARKVVRAPKDGIILQENIREGEYVSASSANPPMVLGGIGPLQIRVDIDEQNASRFDPSYPAVAYPKNNTTLKIPLTFVRIEPYVIPKRSLTGQSDERVDTRVLQVIYNFSPPEGFNMYVGQQVDVFIGGKV